MGVFGPGSSSNRCDGDVELDSNLIEGGGVSTRARWRLILREGGLPMERWGFDPMEGSHPYD